MRRFLEILPVTIGGNPRNFCVGGRPEAGVPPQLNADASSLFGMG